jgi:hypothetical protein
MKRLFFSSMFAIGFLVSSVSYAGDFPAPISGIGDSSIIKRYSITYDPKTVFVMASGVDREGAINFARSGKAAMLLADEVLSGSYSDETILKRITNAPRLYDPFLGELESEISNYIKNERDYIKSSEALSKDKALREKVVKNISRNITTEFFIICPTEIDHPEGVRKGKYPFYESYLEKDNFHIKKVDADTLTFNLVDGTFLQRFSPVATKTTAGDKKYDFKFSEDDWIRVKKAQRDSDNKVSSCVIQKLINPYYVESRHAYNLVDTLGFVFLDADGKIIVEAK